MHANPVAGTTPAARLSYDGARKKPMRCAILVAGLVLAGCYLSFQVYADGDEPDVRSDAADDAARPDDAGEDGHARPDGEADTIDDGDGGDDDDGDATTEECPDSLPTPGLVRLTLRWRRKVTEEWTESGSAALAILDGVVLAIVPQPLGREPRVLRLAADSGTPLDDWPPDLDDFEYTTALATAVHDGTTWVAGAHTFEVATTTAIRTARLLPGGAIRDMAVHAVGLDGVEVRDLRSAADGGRLYVVTEGQSPDGWKLHAVTLEGLVEPGTDEAWLLAAAASDVGEGFVAWAPGDEAPAAVLWTQPERLELRTPTGSNLAAAELAERPGFVPAAAVAGFLPGTYDFLVAGRSAAASTREPVWVERRRGTDLGLVASWSFGGELLAQRPEPRALEPVDAAHVLVWTARRDLGGDEPVASCVYVTPVEGDVSGGATLRIDAGAAEARPPGIEHVRLVVGSDGLYLLWRQEPELWVARVDWSA